MKAFLPFYFLTIAAVLYCCTAQTATSPLRLISATQSSIGWFGAPGRAIDGNTDGHYYNGKSCMHSQWARNNWWMGTLAQDSAVSKVVIYNRVDSCTERIDGIEVYVGNVYCGKITYKPNQVVYEVECRNAVGRSIKVVQNGQYLTLCEVKVFGDTITNQDSCPSFEWPWLSKSNRDTLLNHMCPRSY